MKTNTAGSAGEAGVEAGRGGPGAWLERLPLPAVSAGAVVYLGLGLGLASIGGWVGIAAVFFLAALMIAVVIAAS